MKCKFYPVNSTIMEEFINLPKNSRLAYLELYAYANDYGIVELSKRLVYLEITSNELNDLIDSGLILKLFEDKNIYAITYWNLENKNLKYRTGKSYSEILSNVGGKYSLKSNQNNLQGTQNKIHFLNLNLPDTCDFD